MKSDFQINIKPSLDDNFILDIEPCWTISAIIDLLPFKGLQLQNKLFYNDVELSHEKTLSYYKIPSMSTLLHIVLDNSKIDFVICFPNFQKIIFRLDHEAIVNDLKKIIKLKEDIPSENQKLIFLGKHLEDDIALSTYKIQNYHTIYIDIVLNNNLHTYNYETISDSEDEITINLIYKEIKYRICFPNYGTVNELNMNLSAILNEKRENIIFLYMGRVISVIVILDRNIPNILAIDSTSGGNCLKLMNLVNINK